MSKNRLDEMLDRLDTKQTPSVGDVVALLAGKDKRIIPKPKKKSTSKKRLKRIAEIKAKRGSEEVETIEEIPKIKHIAKIPDGFPAGTILNDDGTLTLPDGRVIRKKQEV